MNYRLVRTSCALVIAAGLASGCEREDAAGDALQKAHVKLTSLAPYGRTLPAPNEKNKTYNEVISSLQKLEKPTPTQKASASVLIAQSHMGIAEPSAARAAELEQEVLHTLRTIRSALGHYRGQSAGASAAASYDPAKELASIESQKAEKEGQIKTEEASKAEIEKQVADLRARSKAKLDESRAKRQQSGSLRQQIPNQSAVQGEKTLVDAMKITREADTLDVAAAELEAKAASVEPGVVEVQNTIDRYTKQLELLAAERTAVMNRDKDAKARSAELRAEAAKTAEEIKTLAEKVHELRTGELEEASNKAGASFVAATKSAGAGVQELRGSAQMVVGMAQQSLGDVLLGKARGMQVYAHVLESLTLATPALPGADTYKARLAETQAAVKETLDTAFAAYKQADEAYHAAGATGEAKARIEKINQRLRDLVKTSGGAEDLIEARGEPAAAPESAATEGGTPAAAAPAAGSPQETLALFMDPSTPAAQKADVFYTTTAAEKEAASAMLGMMEKAKKLDDACKAKFGAGLEGSGGQMMSQFGGGLSASSGLKASDIPVTVNGDSAEATFPGSPKPLKLRQTGGKWQIEFSSLVPPEQMPMVAAGLAPAGKVMEELTAEVEAGKFADGPAVMQALIQRMMAGAMQNMPTGRGGGG